MNLMKKTNNKYVRTINTITTVDNKMFDDILLFKGIEYKTKMIKLLSDHFVVINEFKY